MINRPYVEVVADGTKNYGQLFDALGTLIDDTKMRETSKFILWNSAHTERQIFSYILQTVNDRYVFANENISGAAIVCYQAILRPSGSKYQYFITGQSSVQNITSTVPPSGETYRLTY